jgi:hypothetical protein
MSVATLIGGALKTRQTGAREAQTASAELPERILPAKSRLTRVLSDYQKRGLDLSESQAHLARAETDEQSALNNLELSDEESANRIAVCQRNRGIYGARVTSREANVKKLGSELENAVRDAHTELFNLVRAELQRREGILVERVCTAIQIVDRAKVNFDWIEVLDFSEPFRTIRNLEPTPFQTFAGSAPDHVTRTAHKLLEGYQTIQTESEKSI